MEDKLLFTFLNIKTNTNKVVLPMIFNFQGLNNILKNFGMNLPKMSNQF